MKTAYGDITPYVTKDGSLIRELMHPSAHPVRNLSLAEAVVRPGAATLAHAHRRAEELYHVTAGSGRMFLGGEAFDVGPGDTVRIGPGVRHHVENTGSGELRILCCCSPPYGHEDTELKDP
ncbi:cupin domain-containing protein [Desulfocurvus sp. DL9XJH121]